MTIEQAIEIIRQEYLCVDRDCNIEKNCGNCDLAMPSKEPILEAYKMAIKALEQNQWIPVSERLPKDDTEVLITYIYSGHEIVNVAWINNREWYYRNDILLSDVKVIAWMPLPEPMRLENK